MSRSKLLAVLPARGGSKGIPKKNIRLLGGKPLIAYTIEAAKGVSAIDRLIVSTDDAEIAEVAREYGADVPFLRPKELAGDAAPVSGAILHLLSAFPFFSCSRQVPFGRKRTSRDSFRSQRRVQRRYV